MTPKALAFRDLLKAVSICKTALFCSILWETKKPKRISGKKKVKDQRKEKNALVQLVEVKHCMAHPVLQLGVLLVLVGAGKRQKLTRIVDQVNQGLVQPRINDPVLIGDRNFELKPLPLIFYPQV